MAKRTVMCNFEHFNLVKPNKRITSAYWIQFKFFTLKLKNN